MNTRGPPPGPPPKIRSANPSPFTSPAATNTPLRRVWRRAEAKKSLDQPGRRAEHAWCRRTSPIRGPPTNPAATTRSAVPSPFMSPTAGAGAAAEVRVVDAEEVRPPGRTSPPLKIRDPRPAALVRGDDDVGVAVAVEVAGADEHAAGEVGERPQGEDRAVGRPVDHHHGRGDRRAGADDVVGDAVAGHVRDRQANAAGEPGAPGVHLAGEAGREGEERGLPGAVGVEHAHQRRPLLDDVAEGVADRGVGRGGEHARERRRRARPRRQGVHRDRRRRAVYRTRRPRPRTTPAWCR